MATSNYAIFPQTLKTFLGRIQAADTTSLVTIATAGADGTAINSISIASQDTVSARVIRFYKTRGSVDYLMGAISVPASSGFSGAAATVNVFNFATTGLVGGYDQAGNEAIILESGDTLRAASATTVSGQISFVCEGMNY